tara:strand:+ start:926 stop:1153 length:228 start_codon:yes stop_codon:yes gene_type:complete
MLSKEMSVAKITTVKLNPSTPTDTEINNKNQAGRVDINHLLDRARKEKSDDRKTSLIYTSLFSLIVVIVVTVLSF